MGYQCFVVNYRLQPYTQEEGALDLARAVRYVRSHAKDYGIKEEDIAVIGFSAVGILCGEMVLSFDGTVNGSALDPDYVPDELDKISADAGAVGMIYSFYGRLSVASKDVEKFKKSDLPPTYFLYGSEEVFRGQIEACADAVEQADVPVESKILNGFQHGFGYQGEWFAYLDRWLTDVFNKGITSTSEKNSLPFPLGEPNTTTEYFSGETYKTKMIAHEDVFNLPAMDNVTFAPASRSNWHSNEGGEILLVTGGVGLYQEKGEPAKIIRKGDVVQIKQGVIHWHGAAKDSWASHIEIATNPDTSSIKWLEAVSNEQYNNLQIEEFAERTNLVPVDDLMFTKGQPMTNENFSGTVYISAVFESDESLHAPFMSYVVFEPGVINNWHIHGGGQVLIATDGIGYHQILGQPVEVLYPGDVALCPPGVQHWHGGAADKQFAHIAIGTNPEAGGVQWLDRISEEEYRNLPRK